MSTIRKIKVCLNIKPGELTCPNPEIIWGSNPNILKNCVFKDGCIEVSILEDDLGKLKGKCIPYTIICDNCGNCPPKDGEACFCDNGDDCSNCQNCVTGVCVDKCPGKICKPDGTCVDCMDGTCPGNQQCIDGKCQCPPNKPYQDGNGNCYGCKSDTECPPCYKCDGSGNCVPRDCGNLACDPTLDKCVECVDSTKCKPNEVCINNKCECGPGYERNPLTGLCEPKPECKTKEDCGPCKHCIDGECVDIKCPDGFKCVDDNCVPDPCGSKPCENGTDCGEDCGCKDKICTECASLSCEECAKSLGCVCNPVTGACEKKVTCDDEPCVTKYDCSQDCGCDQSECKDCANYSCEDCGKVPGCKCVNGKCIGDGDRGCKDTFTLTPDKCDATLTAKLTKTQPCACETLTSKISIAYLDRGKSTLSIRKGKAEFDTLLPLLSPESKNNSETENLVTSATLRIVLTALDGTGKDVKTTTVTKSLNSLGEKALVGPTVITGLDANQLAKISTVNYKVSLTDVVFKDSKCTYADQELINENFEPYKGTDSVTFTNSNPDVLVERFAQLESEDFRDPLFIWYRSKDSSFSSDNIIRKQYIPIVNGFYADKLTLDKGFLPKFDYRVETDCSCNEGVSLEDVVICEDINLPIKLTQCNTRLEFTDDIKICDLSNTNLAPYAKIISNILTNSLDDITYANTVFELLVNNIKVGEFKAGTNKVLKTKDYLYNSTTNITSVALVVKVDGVVKCRVEETFVTASTTDPTVTTICSDLDSGAIVRFQPSLNSAISKIQYLEGNPYTIQNGKIEIKVPKDDTYTFKIFFANDCVKDFTYEVSCCASKSINFVADSTLNAAVITESVVTEAEAKIFYLRTKGFSNAAVITTTKGSINVNKNLALTYDQILSINGSESIKVTIEEGNCKKEATLIVKRLGVKFTVSNPTCGEGTLTIEGDAGVSYKVLGVEAALVDGVIPANGVATIPTNNGNNLSPKTYTLQLYNNYPTGLTVTYQKLGAPDVLQITSNNGATCGITTIDIILVGLNLSPTDTYVTYKIGASGVLIEKELTQNNLGQSVLTIDRPLDKNVNIYLSKVKNGTGTLVCEKVIDLVSDITIANESIVSVESLTCNTATSKFSAVLSLDPDFTPGVDTVTFNPVLPAGASFSSTTKTITGLPLSTPYNPVVTAIIGGKTQCPKGIILTTGTCTCNNRNITIVDKPTFCKKTAAGVTNSTFTTTPTTGTDFVIQLTPSEILSFTSDNASDIKVYISKGTGEERLLPGGNNVINYNTVNGRLTITSFEVTPGFLSGVNYNDLELVVRVKAKANFCDSEIEKSITVNNLDSIVNANLSYEFYYSPSGVARTPGDFSSSALLIIPANLENQLYAKLNFAGTFPINGEVIWNVKAYSAGVLFSEVTQTFGISDINNNIVELFDATGVIINRLEILVTKRLGSEDCFSVLKQFRVDNTGSNYVTIKRGSTSVSAPQNLCKNGAAEVFGHDYVAGPVVSQVWKFNGNNIGTGTTVLFDPSAYDPVSESPLSVELTLDTYEVLIGFVLMNILPAKPALFDIPTAPVFTGFSGGSYILPNASNGVEGSWSPGSLVTSTTGTKAAVFTPTGGQCSEVYNYSLVVVDPPVVSTPDVNISGASSGCGSVELNIDYPNATQYFVTKVESQLNTCPPSGLSPLTASTYIATTSGTYYFMSKDTTTCSAKKSFSVTVNPKVGISPAGLPTSVSLGTSLTLPPTVAGVSGSWSPSSSVNTSTIGFRTHTFIPIGCYTNLTHTVEVTCPAGSTVSISNLTDVCATSFAITSSYYDTFTTTINGSLIVTGPTLARTNFNTGSNTIEVIATKAGVPCTETFEFTYSKCQTCTLGVCDPCSDVLPFTVTYDLEASKEVRLNLHTSYNITYAAVSSKTFTGGDFVSINNTLPNNKVLRVIWDNPNQCADAGPNSITVDYSFAYTPIGGSPIVCDRQFIYNFTMDPVVYVPTGTGGVFGPYVIGNEGAYVLGYSNNTTYNSTQSFTVSGPDLVDGTITFEIDIAADNYLAVEINGNPITSHGELSNSTIGFTSPQTTVIDKADLISGVNALALEHYNETDRMSLYVKIHRLVSGVRSSILYDAHVDLPILSC